MEADATKAIAPTTGPQGRANEVIGKDFADSVTIQNYGARPAIAGVQLVELRLFLDDGGSFNELVRLRPDGTVEALPDFCVRQCSYSEVMPGAIKAWHLHQSQEDLWFVPPAHRLLVGLLDVREGSPTYKNSMRLVMGGGSAKLLRIPAGVAHGAANLSQAPAAILYFTSAQFSAVAPDELRLPWDLVGAEFWQTQPG
jgi:dTDP-4-dehydrorhamnose 3,5-epimerase